MDLRLFISLLLLGSAFGLCAGCKSHDRTRYLYVCKDASDTYVEYPDDGWAVLFYDGYKHHLQRVASTASPRYEGRFYRWDTDEERVRATLRSRDASALEEESSIRCERAP